MSKATMFLWTFLIVLLLGAILFIGYTKQDRVYVNLVSSLEKTTRNYVLKNNNPKLNDKVIVFIEELVDNDYIKEEELETINNYCIKSIVYTKGLIKDEYDFNRECENEE